MNKDHPFKSVRNSVFYIAEIGGNHEGNYAYAQQLTKLAIESGADVVKFQFYSGDTLVSRHEDRERNDHFKKFELSKEQNLKLIRMVEGGGAIPMASLWSKEMVNWADQYFTIHKVGSGDLTCYPMLAALAITGKPIILSTGLSSLHEVANAVKYIENIDASYISQRKLALLQCTSTYPTPNEDANIDAMLTLKEEFGLPVGYSDHTLGADAIEVAVALGAEIIEKHFTDIREGKTFRDHKLSLTCDEVRITLDRMRRITTLKGNIEKVLTSSEKESGHLVTFRRGIYAACDISAGETITSDNITVLRPAHGLCASRFDEVLGRKSIHDIPMYQPIKEDDLE